MYAGRGEKSADPTGGVREKVPTLPLPLTDPHSLIFFQATFRVALNS